MNIRTLTKTLMIFAAFACFIVTLTFSTALSAEQKGNQTKGRYYFRQTCKTCHTKGAKGGEVTPLTKTIAQWKRYFATAKHDKGAEELTKIMPAAQINDVETFLVAHAADSLQPETCGK